jgi:hypothetical protein
VYGPEHGAVNRDDHNDCSPDGADGGRPGADSGCTSGHVGPEVTDGDNRSATVCRYHAAAHALLSARGNRERVLLATQLIAPSCPYDRWRAGRKK